MNAYVKEFLSSTCLCYRNPHRLFTHDSGRLEIAVQRLGSLLLTSLQVSSRMRGGRVTVQVFKSQVKLGLLNGLCLLLNFTSGFLVNEAKFSDRSRSRRKDGALLSLDASSLGPLLFSQCSK